LLARARVRHGMRLYAWVFMPEHVHLVLRAAGSPWSTIAQYLKTGLSKRVIGRWKKLGPSASGILRAIKDEDGHRFWLPGGGFDRKLRSTQAIAKEIRYVHRNPVERGLVSAPEEWKWSSVRWWMGMREGELECDKPLDPELDPEIWHGFT